MRRSAEPRCKVAEQVPPYACWRLHVGTWRVVYTVEADRLLVLVLLTGGRGDVYERLKRRLG